MIKTQFGTKFSISCLIMQKKIVLNDSLTEQSILQQFFCVERLEQNSIV